MSADRWRCPSTSSSLLGWPRIAKRCKLSGGTQRSLNVCTYLKVVVDVTTNDTGDLALEQLHEGSSEVGCCLSSSVAF